MTHSLTLKAVLIFTSIFLGLSFSLDAQKLKIPQGNLGGGGEITLLDCYDPAIPELSITIANTCGWLVDCSRINVKNITLSGFPKHSITSNPFATSGVILSQGQGTIVTFQFSPAGWNYILNNRIVDSKVQLNIAMTYSIEERVENNSFNANGRPVGDSWVWSDDISFSGGIINWTPPALCQGNSSQRFATVEVSEKITISPNPSKKDISIDYSLKEESNVSAFLYNSIGQKVKTIINNELQSEGVQNINISIEDLKAGIYYFIIRDGGRTRTEKIVKV